MQERGPDPSSQPPSPGVGVGLAVASLGRWAGVMEGH